MAAPPGALCAAHSGRWAIFQPTILQLSLGKVQSRQCFSPVSREGDGDIAALNDWGGVFQPGRMAGRYLSPWALSQPLTPWTYPHPS